MNKIWSISEVDILMKNYNNLGPEECLKLLKNKSKRQITSKANKLGLSFKNDSIKRYSYEYFSKIVKLSISISDVARNLGLSTGRGNRKTVVKYINKYNINTAHFEKKSKNNISNFKGRNLEDILISGSTYTTTNNLKKRLYKANLLEPICCICGQDENWFNMKISLILDHINGVNNDNRLENLRILCPNCNAGQDTFCRGNKIIKKDKINKKKKNFKNHNINKRKINRPPYDQLIKEIEELGYSGTGRKYGVSDNSIRKWKKYYEKY